MLVAILGPTAPWPHGTIAFVGGRFVVGGHGPLPARDVLQYAALGELEWVSEYARELVTTAAIVDIQPPASPVAARPPAPVCWRDRHRRPGTVVLVLVPAAVSILWILLWALLWHSA